MLRQSAIDVDVAEARGSPTSLYSLFPPGPRPASDPGYIQSGSSSNPANRLAGRAGARKQEVASSMEVTSTNPPCGEMIFSCNMNPITQTQKRPRSREDNAARLAVRRNGGACAQHKATKKKVRIFMYPSKPQSLRMVSSQCHCRNPRSSSSLSKASAGSVLNLRSPDRFLDSREPPVNKWPTRLIISRTLLQVMKTNQPTESSFDLPREEFAVLFHEDFPELLKTAARALAADPGLELDVWQPLRQLLDAIFGSFGTVLYDIGEASPGKNAERNLLSTLFRTLTSILKLLYKEVPTVLDLFVLLKDLQQHIDYWDSWSTTPGVKVLSVPWSEIVKLQLHTVRRQLPPETPVFTCPFPLAGCTYQTTNMQQWVLHKDQCRERRSASRIAGPFENETNEALDRCCIRSRDVRRFFTLGKVFAVLWHEPATCAVPTRTALRRRVRDITTSIVGLLSYPKNPSRDEGCTDGRHLPQAPPLWDRRLLFEAIYRIVWLELLRLFGLCMLSVLPLCTNMLGFVVCRLTILRLVSMWKCKGKLLMMI